MHPVASVTIVGPRVAFMTIRNTLAGPQPAHARCPGRKMSGFEAMSLGVNFHSWVVILISSLFPQPNVVYEFVYSFAVGDYVKVIEDFLDFSWAYVSAAQSVDVVNNWGS